MMLGREIFLMTIPSHPELYNPFFFFLVVIVVQGSNLKVGEFEGLRVSVMDKAFELGRFSQCTGLKRMWV